MSEKSQWGSKLGFILASAGSAIGLGAVWKFPYMTAANGGGGFLLVFLISTILIGFPLLLAEICPRPKCWCLSYQNLWKTRKE